jgi:hypothetical protein
VEIAKQEAQTVKPGNPTGANQYSMGEWRTTVLIPRLTATAMTGTNNPAYSAAWPSKAAMTFSTAWLREKPAPLPTERVAIAKAIEEEIGKIARERQIALAGTRPNTGDLPVDRPEGTGNETRAIAAEKSGFGTVVAVVENHTPKSGMTFAVELNSVR